jgi:hypothetical protein
MRAVVHPFAAKLAANEHTAEPIFVYQYRNGRLTRVWVTNRICVEPPGKCRLSTGSQVKPAVNAGGAWSLAKILAFGRDRP